MTGFARPIIRMALPWMLALMAVLSTPAQAQMWRWYDQNPGDQPNVLKNGSVCAR